VHTRQKPIPKELAMKMTAWLQQLTVQVDTPICNLELGACGDSHISLNRPSTCKFTSMRCPFPTQKFTNAHKRTSGADLGNYPQKNGGNSVLESKEDDSLQGSSPEGCLIALSLNGSDMIPPRRPQAHYTNSEVLYLVPVQSNSASFGWDASMIAVCARVHKALYYL
jgi:hypothetical protein